MTRNTQRAKAVGAGIAGTTAMTLVATFGAPMMGMGFFSGGIAPAMGSLVGHLVYGAVVGGVYGTCAPCVSQRACGCA